MRVILSNEIIRNVNSVISNNKSTRNRILIKYYLLSKLLQLTRTQNLVRHTTNKREEILLTNSWIDWLVKLYMRKSGK